MDNDVNKKIKKIKTKQIVDDSTNDNIKNDMTGSMADKMTDNIVADNIVADNMTDIMMVDNVTDNMTDNVTDNVTDIKKYFCYILRNSYDPHANRTYNGYTVNPKNRIRQHNQELKGGAKYTKQWGNKTWEMYVLITGFPDNHCALQCEWRIKHPAKKRIRPTIYNSPAGRVIGLNEIFQLEKWTSKSETCIKNLNLELWIVKEYAHLLTNIPVNIKVNVVNFINLDDFVVKKINNK